MVYISLVFQRIIIIERGISIMIVILCDTPEYDFQVHVVCVA